MRWRFRHFLLLAARRRLAALFTDVIFSLSSAAAAVCIFEIDECDRLILGLERVCVFAPLQQQAAATTMMMMMLLAASVSETRWCGGWKMN
jgi:hypothetical protein